MGKLHGAFPLTINSQHNGESTKKLTASLTALVLCAVTLLPAQVFGQNSDKVVPPGARNSSPKLKAKFRRSPAEKKIPDQYIVVLNDDVEDVEQEAERLAIEHGGSRYNQHTYRRVLKGYSVWMPEAQARKLAQDPRVDYVEEDQTVTASATQSNATWGLDRIDQRDLPLNSTYTYNYTGAGVKAYIIDTGIRPSHSQLGGRVVAGYSAINVNCTLD